MTTNWIEDYLPLPRPEYPKQSEALLTDLLWRSKGSILSGDATPGSAYLRKLANLKRQDSKLPPMSRLIPLHVSGNTTVIQTFQIAKDANLDQVISLSPGIPFPTRAFLNSIVAPKSRGDRSITCVPINPQAVIFQTLNGLINKNDPPNMAEAIEAVGQLGGAVYNGEVAKTILELLSTGAKPTEGLTGLLDNLFPEVAKQTWDKLPTLPGVEQGQSLPIWPTTADMLSSNLDQVAPGFSLISSYQVTPFNWFWENWKTLCDPEAGWFDNLPTRRFIDWALCLLRTALAFSYMWEASFFCKLQDCINEKVKTPTQTKEIEQLKTMLKEGFSLAVFDAPRVPITQKDNWKRLGTHLARGYETRNNIKALLDEQPPNQVNQGFTNLGQFIEDWLNTTPTNLLENLSKQPIELKPDTAKNIKYFVRYLLQPRSSDDDLIDQADFYYLAQTNSNGSSFWFQPGPEWLVVISSLQCKKPGGKCTLRSILSDLSKLGIQVERSVLVGMLEEAGLSMDSPDADNALIINSAF